MLKTDRLFEIIHILRKAHAPVTAQDLALTLEVTPRTVYRYIAMLQSMRIPIEGAAGIGYVMRRGYDLPPLNFSEDELEAIVVGLSLLARTGDSQLLQSARRVLGKIETSRIPHNSLRVAEWGIAEGESVPMALLRKAIRAEQKVHLTYGNAQGEISERIILPLALTYYVEVAILSAWCELRQDYRNFRVDRITACSPLNQFFTGQGKTLRDDMEFMVITGTPYQPK